MLQESRILLCALPNSGFFSSFHLNWKEANDTWSLPMANHSSISLSLHLTHSHLSIAIEFFPLIYPYSDLRFWFRYVEFCDITTGCWNSSGIMQLARRKKNDRDCMRCTCYSLVLRATHTHTHTPVIIVISSCVFIVYVSVPSECSSP